MLLLQALFSLLQKLQRWQRVIADLQLAPLEQRLCQLSEWLRESSSASSVQQRETPGISSPQSGTPSGGLSSKAQAEQQRALLSRHRSLLRRQLQATQSALADLDKLLLAKAALMCGDPAR